MHEWVQQQQLLQRAGVWEARGIRAEAANRDLQARLSRANEDRRAAESRLADQGENPGAQPREGAQGRGGTAKATGTDRGGG